LAVITLGPAALRAGILAQGTKAEVLVLEGLDVEKEVKDD
jgi:hypothetical protein